MKQIKMKTIFSMGCFLMFQLSFANSHFSFTCPSKFIATVTQIEDLKSSGFPKVEVRFQVIHIFKGENFTFKKIQIVKDSLLDFKIGQTYTVETRDNWLCNASTITSSL